MEVLQKLIIEDGAVTKNNEVVFTTDEKSVQPFLKALYRHLELKYSKFFKMDFLSKLGYLSSEILLADLDLQPETDDMAIVLANQSSSLQTDVAYQASIADMPSPSVFVYTLPNIVIGEISIRHKIHGEHMFFIQDEYNEKELLDYVDSLFQSTDTKYAMVGWLEVGVDESYKAELSLVKK